MQPLPGRCGVVGEGFEPPQANRLVYSQVQLTTLPTHRADNRSRSIRAAIQSADDGTRTRDFHRDRVAFYLF